MLLGLAADKPGAKLDTFKAVAAALLFVVLGIGSAHATAITGTWSGSGSGAQNGGANPPDPISFSATFSFDDSSTNNGGITNFTTNFGASSAGFNYVLAGDILNFSFDSGVGSLVVAFSPATTGTPVLTTFYWLLHNGGATSTYQTSNGGFDPATAVPEPSSMALLASALIFGLVAPIRRRRAG
jgi:hypothetical protein